MQILSIKIHFRCYRQTLLYARGGYYDNKTRRPYEAYDYNILHETFNYGIGAQYMINKGIILPQTVTPIIFLPLIVFKDNKTYNGKAGEEQVRKRTRNHNLSIKVSFKLGNRHKLSVGTEYIVDV